MSPEMYALINATPFHLRIVTKTTTPDYPDKLNTQGVIIPYTRKESQKSTQNSCVQRITSRRERTYIAQCMIHSTCMSMTPLKWRPRQPHQPLDGTDRCCTTTSSTSSKGRTANQCLTQCGRTTSLFLPHTIPKNRPNSSSNDALTVKK